jgi:hypothetical protein
MPAFTEAGHNALEIDGLLYIVGVDSDDCTALLRYDPVSEVWSMLSSLPNGCIFGDSFVLDGCLYAAGGDDEQSKLQRYDVATDVWTELADMPEKRQKFGAITIGNAGSNVAENLFDSLIAKANLRESFER